MLAAAGAHIAVVLLWLLMHQPRFAVCKLGAETYDVREVTDQRSPRERGDR